MRLFSLIALALLIVPHFAWAQSHNGKERRVYNRTQTGIASSQIYNSSSGLSDRGAPIALKQILQGKSSSSSSSNSSYYGGKNYRPYGADNNSYSLALSPAEIRESRANRDRLARQYERENANNLQQQALLNSQQEQADSYLQQFQPALSTGSANTPVRKVRKVYKKRDSGFDVPKKVFNSIR